MDESFSFRAPASAIRRRVHPLTARAVAAACAVLAIVATVGRIAVQSERASDERVAAAALSMATGGGLTASGPIDPQARSGIEGALELAQEVYARTGRFAGAGTVRLAKAQPGLIFVDGPSTAPPIVSVEAANEAWAAAAMTPSGMCLWVRATSDQTARYGAGRACTGSAAMAADDITW
jgi:hypothetical protein